MYIHKPARKPSRPVSSASNNNTSSSNNPEKEQATAQSSVLPMLHQGDLEAQLPRAAGAADGKGARVPKPPGSASSSSAPRTHAASDTGRRRRLVEFAKAHTVNRLHPEKGPGDPGGTGGPGVDRAATAASRRSGSHLQFRLRKEGDSGRRGFHPWHFFRIAFRSSSKVSACVNVLWPFVPAAIVCRYALADSPRNHLITFILAYIAMVPCANLIGFAGQELSRKVPHVLGVLTETTVASIVEIVLFHVLLTRGLYSVIQAAILGSVLATMLLCLGLCFFIGGLKREEQEFSETVSEAGSGLLLTAGFGLAVPTLFQHTLAAAVADPADLQRRTLNISRVSAVLLMIAYLVFIYFQARTHHGIYDEIFEGEEVRAAEHAAQEAAEHRRHGELDYDAERAAERAKLTMTECLLALALSVTLVSLIALSLVEEIEYIVTERHISDAFMGLILVPLVEKAAEHMTAVDEAYDNQMNFALAHVLGATLQTAMFNGPLVVIVGWGLHRPMGLDFELFDMGVLILAIITVGNFLRDQKSNYLEGLLCVIVYISIAVAAYNYPNVATESEGAGEGAGETAEAVVQAVRSLLR